jgi:hypothetical protein
VLEMSLAAIVSTKATSFESVGRMLCHPLHNSTHLPMISLDGNRFGAKAQIGKGHVFRKARVQMATRHEQCRSDARQRLCLDGKVLVGLVELGNNTILIMSVGASVDAPRFLHGGNAVVDVTVAFR